MPVTLDDLVAKADIWCHHAILLVNRRFAEESLSPTDFSRIAEAWCGIKLTLPNDVSSKERGKDSAKETDDGGDFWEMASRHPDLFVVDRERANLRLEEVGPLRKLVQFPPAVARKRLFLIERCERMGQSAANSLLKTLEEPSIEVLFLLTASRQSEVLPTILSRCRKISYAFHSGSRPSLSEQFEPEDWQWLRKMVAAAKGEQAVVCSSLWERQRLSANKQIMAEIMDRSTTLGRKYEAGLLQDALAALLAKRFSSEPRLASLVREVRADLVRWREAEAINASRSLWLSRILLRCTQ